MFGKPDYVFKDGRLIVRDGKVIEVTWGATHVARPASDGAMDRQMSAYFERFQTVRSANFRVADGEIEDVAGGRLVKHTPAGARAP